MCSFLTFERVGMKERMATREFVLFFFRVAFISGGGRYAAAAAVERTDQNFGRSSDNSDPLGQ